MNEQSSVSPLRGLIIASLLGLAFALCLVAFSYWMDGSTLATRSATSLVMPVGVAWIGALTGALFFAFKRDWSAALLFATGFVFLGITGNPFIAAQFIGSVEMAEQPVSATKTDPFRAVVVLGGGESMTLDGTEELNRNGERIFSAAQLWHAGLVSSVICTGSDPRQIANPRDVAKTLLESVGVPAEVIYKIPGENTSQEMRSLKKFIDDPPAGFPEAGEIALITSAFHMQRAIRLAAVQGLDIHPLPCGYLSVYRPNSLVPTAEAAGDFGSALKEVLGGLVGR